MPTGGLVRHYKGASSLFAFSLCFGAFSLTQQLSLAPLIPDLQGPHQASCLDFTEANPVKSKLGRTWGRHFNRERGGETGQTAVGDRDKRKGAL